MKKYVFAFAFALPFTAFAQDGNKYNLSSNNYPEAPVVNLKIEPVAKPGQTAVIVGAALQVVGLGVALAGPSFISAPVDPTSQYLQAIRLSGDNVTSANIKTKNYLSDYSTYLSEVDSKRKTGNALRAFGAGTFAIGTAFNISGLMKMISK